MKNKLPQSLHYAPSSGLFGDPMPFYWQGEYRVDVVVAVGPNGG